MRSIRLHQIISDHIILHQVTIDYIPYHTNICIHTYIFIYICGYTLKEPHEKIHSRSSRRKVLTACADGVTRLFDAATGQCQGDFRRLGDHGGPKESLKKSHGRPTMMWHWCENDDIWYDICFFVGIDGPNFKQNTLGFSWSCWLEGYKGLLQTSSSG